MSSRDDMVIRATLKEERAALRHGERGGGAHAALAKAKSRRMRKAMLARETVRRIRTRGARGARGLARLGLARGLVGGTIGAAALAGLIAARLASGRTFGGMGKWLGEQILGDMDEHAIARSMASERIMQQPELMLEVLRHGRATPFIEGLHKSLAEDVYYPQARGGALFGLDERFDVNSLLDIVIIRLRELVEISR